MERSRYKEIAIVSFVALYTIIFFVAAARLFAGMEEFTVSFTSAIGVAGIIWVAIVALASILSIDKGAVALIIALIPAATLLVIGKAQIASLIGAGLLFLLTFVAQQSIFQEMNRYVRIRMSTICSFGVRMLLFGMLLSFVVFSVPLLQHSIATNKIAIPRQYVHNTVALYVDNPDQITDAVQAYITTRAQQNSFVIVLIVIAIALLAVRTLVPIVSWPTLALVTLLFWIAKRAHIVTIAEHTASVEYIEV